MPSLVANSPVTWPKPRLPSTIAIVSLSNTIVGGVLGLSHALAHPFEILAHAQHAVRIVADEIGVDEPARDGARLLGVRAAACMIGGDEIDELCGGNGAHRHPRQWISGSGVGAVPSRKSKSQPWSACVTCCW